MLKSCQILLQCLKNQTFVRFIAAKMKNLNFNLVAKIPVIAKDMTCTLWEKLDPKKPHLTIVIRKL